MTDDNNKDITKEELQEWEEWAKEYEESKNEEYGAGEEGTDELRTNYTNATPGQTLDNEHNNG